MRIPDDGLTVGELSEGEILRRILDRLGPSAALIGPGDDAAVLAAPDGRVVVTTDTLVHGPDFRLAWSSAFDLGWKSAAVSLADGLRAACDALAPGCVVEGGDLTVSDTLTIAVTALGSLDGREPVLRSGARDGDVVALAGDLGRAARGLAVLFARFTDAAGAPLAVDPAVLSPDEIADLSAQ